MFLKRILPALALLTCVSLRAQDGQCDYTFNALPTLNPGATNGFEGTVRCIKRLNNGKIIVYGGLYQYMGTNVSNLVRLKPNGARDTSFSVTGLAASTATYIIWPSLIEEQPNGKLLVGGSFTSFNGQTRNRIVRLNLNGSLDSTFSTGTGFDGPVHVVRLQPDGKILCGGNFSAYNGVSRKGMARLNTDGTLDTSFDIQNGFSSENEPDAVNVNSIELQANGKIIAAGRFTHFNGEATGSVVRLESNGAIDPTFAVTTSTPVYRALINPNDGSIYLAGPLLTFGGQQKGCVARVLADGSLDTNFQTPDGLGVSFSAAYDIGLFPDGRLLVGGNFTTSTGNILAILDEQGALDPSFHFTAQFSSAGVYSVSITPSGQIIAGGDFFSVEYSNPTYATVSVTKGRIVQLNPDGSTDLTFNPVIGPQYGGLGLKGYYDSFLLGARFYNERFYPHSPVVSMDGSAIDSNLNIPANKTFIEMEDAPDGGHYFLSYNQIYHLLDSGELDPTFQWFVQEPLQFDFRLRTFEVQSDGKIVIGGAFKYVTAGPPYPRQNLVRINPDGTLDTTYLIGSGFSDPQNANYLIQGVYAMAKQPDEKIIMAGYFSKYQGLPENNIIRLNPDGSKDTTFLSGSGFNANVEEIILHPDGRILAVGRFTTYNGTTNPFITRLNSDGTIDTTFTSPFDTDNGLYARIDNVCMQPDGKYIVFGWIGNTSKLLRLNSDGSMDTSFNSGNIFYYDDTSSEIISASSSHLELLGNGTIVLSGWFNKVNGVVRNRLALFSNQNGLVIDEPPMPTAPALIANPVDNRLVIFRESVTSVNLYDLSGREILSTANSAVDVSNLGSGIYLLRVQSASGSESCKFLKR